MSGENGLTENPNVTPGSPLFGGLKVMLGAAIVAAALYFGVGIGVDLLVPVLPDSAVEWAVNKYTWIRVPESRRDLEAERSIQQLADRLHAANPDSAELKVLVVRDGMVNAFAFPDGTVMLFSGLLKQMKSENELAFILGHESAHVSNRDALRKLGRSFVYGVFVSSIGLGREHVFENPATISELAFSRSQEAEADRIGMDMAYNLYGHVAGVNQFFLDMTEEKDAAEWENYFRSHPLAENRIEALEDHAAEMGYGQGSVLPLILPGPDDESL